MKPSLAVFLSILILGIGFIGLFIMLKVLGASPKPSHPKTSIRLHRWLGYLFLALYLFLFIMMGLRLTTGGSRSSLVVMHLTLATLVIPVFLIKILIARGFRGLYRVLPPLGLAVFVLTVTLVTITAGPHLLDHRSTGSPEMTDPFGDAKVEDLLQLKCTPCHGLEKVRSVRLSVRDWEMTIQRMIGYTEDPDYLSARQQAQLAEYLSGPAGLGRLP